MIKILLNGCLGAMGLVISEIAAKEEGIEIVAGVDRKAADKDLLKHLNYKVYESTKLIDDTIEADVCIDFSHISAVDNIVDYCTAKTIPLVLCTTGLSSEQLEKIEFASKKTALLKSANMSLGVNLLLKLAAQASTSLKNKGFDIEIVEKHHHRKLDAPSGTALALADSINDACGNTYEYTYGRSQRHIKRPDNEIGISSVRAGSIVGEHDVIFAGEDELITLSHNAYSRSIFAKGAIEAAKYLYNKAPGKYTMFDVL